jgi:hypothetical protein
LKYENPCGDRTICSDGSWGIKLNYINSTVAPYSYYVVADTGIFMVNGSTVLADAVYSDDANTYCATPPSTWNISSTPPDKRILQVNHGGSLWLSDSSGNTIDSVGWYHTGSQPTICSPGCIFYAFAADQQFVRLSSTGGASNVWGRAYDVGVSSIDFVYPSAISGFVYQPYSSSNSTATVIAGKPAIGAVITANDGLSDATTAYSVGSPPRADFLLMNVATSTIASPWTVLITSGIYTLQNDTVTIATSGSNYNFPSSTTILNQPTTEGFIAGRVTDVLGNPITSPSAIIVSPGTAGSNTTASTLNGRYMMRVSTGSVDVTANPSNANNSYVSVSSLGVTVALGQISDGVNFILSQGGRISGFVTRDGINPLPGVAVAALDLNGYARDTQVTDNNGRFTTINITTGTYDMTPELDSLESSTPTSRTVTVGSGQTVFSTTFTVSGALGTITGSVTSGGNGISTGVLIVVTTVTLAGTPPALPALSSNTLSGSPYYIASSKEDGTYSIDVRQSTSTTYRAYAYYTTLSSTGAVTTQTQTLTNISVLAGQTVTGKNFAW